MPKSVLEQIVMSQVLRESTLKAAISALALPKGSAGLDAGCGAGLQSLLLANQIGGVGHVTGLDVSSELLSYGEKFVNDAGLEKQITLVEGHIESIPFDDDAFDWVWSADCVGYGRWDTKALLKELKRVTKPGGKIAILAWSSERLLPGHLFLEAKLSATTIGLAPFSKEMAPEKHFHRALGQLRGLGLEALKAEVFAGSAHAPLSDDLLAALELMFEMRWVGAEDELTEDDRVEFNRLCKKESPDFILKHPDYYGFFTYSMFSGTVPARR